MSEGESMQPKTDYSYLKPAIAAKMQLSVDWFNASGKKNALQWALAIGFCWHDEKGELLPDWQEALIEFHAKYLARANSDETFLHNGAVITIRFSELWGHWQLINDGSGFCGDYCTKYDALVDALKM